MGSCPEAKVASGQSPAKARFHWRLTTGLRDLLIFNGDWPPAAGDFPIASAP